ncbi:MAG: NmrA family NAD(P)-binding protein [Bacteroidales bacterium]
MRKKILITGATGNIGVETIHSLLKANSDCEVFAGIRNIEKTQQIFPDYTNLKYRKFDFNDNSTFNSAFEGIDVLFLLRPPQISDVNKIFEPMVETAINCGITKFVFLSVQGADKTSFIPHAKIEEMILSKNVEYIFLRPSYFMQNLTTTLAQDLKNGVIKLPAGQAKFNWIDVANIGEFAANIILNFDSYKNKAFDITGSQNLSFSEAIEIINDTLKINLKFKSLNLLSFFFYKKSQGVSQTMILVMIMLHFLPRFQNPPAISLNYQNILNKPTTTLSEFAKREHKLIRQD